MVNIEISSLSCPTCSSSLSLAILNSMYFHLNSIISISIFTKKAYWNFNWDSNESLDQFGKIKATDQYF